MVEPVKGQPPRCTGDATNEAKKLSQSCPAPVAFRKQNACESCGVVFSLFTRRHHCRRCGKSVCGAHSSMMQIKLHAVTRDEQMTRNLPRVRTCHDCKQTVLLALRHSGKQMRPLDAEEVEKLRRSEKAVDGGQDARRWCGTEDDAMDELSR